MKQRVLIAALVAVTALVPSARIASAKAPTLKTITVDGDFSDWSEVLVNALNVTLDGDGSVVPCAVSTDRDCKVQSTGRDIRRFAWTYDHDHVYVYVDRQGSSSNTEVFWHYFDLNLDEKMGIGDVVLRVRFSGSNGTSSNDLYAYSPLTQGGDAMVDAGGFADGFTIPGLLLSPPLWSESAPDGGGPYGAAFEERVPFSALGIAPGTPLNFHVSSSNSANPGNVAGQVDDNLGAIGGGLGSFGFHAVTIGPPGLGSASGGGTALYSASIRNTGQRADSFDMKAESTLGLSVTFSTDPDRNGAPDDTIAVDSNGDGDFADAGDVITPGWDRDASGRPDTPLLVPGETFPIVVTITTRAGQSNVTDVTSVTALLASSPTTVNATVTETTSIGAAVLLRSRTKGATSGQDVAHALQACSISANDTFALAAMSTQGYSVALYSDPDCDGVRDTLMARDDDGNGTWDSILGGDTDGDGLPDTGLLAPGGCSCMVVLVTLPAGAPVGTTDVTTVQARGRTSGVVATADLTTTVGRIIDISPDYSIADLTERRAGAGRSVYFPHVVVNNANVSDVADFYVVPPTSSQGWPVRVYSDPDEDGSIQDGSVITRTVVMAANGGMAHVVVEVRIPVDAVLGSTNTTVVTAASVVNTANRDTASDDVTVSRITTYSDPLFTQATSYFGPCSTIRVEATGLESRGGGRVPVNYSLIYVDGAIQPARIVDPFVPDTVGVARDEYTVKAADVIGPWRIELRADTLIDTVANITVEADGVLALETDRGIYPPAGAPLTITGTLFNGNVQAWLEGTSIDYTVVDPTGAAYLVSGSPSTFAPYTGSEISRTNVVPDLGPLSSFVDTFTFANVAYPQEGVFRLIASWTTPCGTIRQATTGIIVGQGETCDNGIDDDGDTLVDCADPECATSPNCSETDCGDGVDNDGDTRIDCADPDCVADPACREADCSDGLDNDADTLVDCADPDCAADPSCRESECRDAVDNDGDTLADCADGDCRNDPACLPETNCDNGVDDDGDTLVDCADPDCAAYPTCSEVNCLDGVDNDADTLVDCADPDCALSPACLDTDGDTVPNALDCAPTNPTAFAFPLEVELLEAVKLPLLPTAALLRWASQAVVAGSGTEYDIVTGIIGHLRIDDGFARAGCLPNGTNLTTVTVIDQRLRPGVVVADGYYYLVRSENACGQGPVGFDSLNRQRDVSRYLCP